ncbi:MAG: hypothetical protein WCI74_21495 [Actinomycetes bacterium]
MPSESTNVYDFTHWYSFAQAERNKLAYWQVDQGALYAVRFLVQNWITDASLPRTANMWGLRDVGGALMADIADYNVRGITLMHAAPGATLAVMSAGQITDMTQMQADAGTWVVDLVISATASSTVLWASNASWLAYVANVLGNMGYGTPNVSLMGVVTVHCSDNTSICRPFGVDDPNPAQTSQTEAFWLGMPDLFRGWIPKAKSDQIKALAKVNPNDPQIALLMKGSISSLDAYNDSRVKQCVGLGGQQMAIGFHDHVGLDGDLIPIFKCSDGGSGLITPDNVEPGPPAVDPELDDIPSPLTGEPAGFGGLLRLSTNQKLVLGVFVAAGFLIGHRLRRIGQ